MSWTRRRGFSGRVVAFLFVFVAVVASRRAHAEIQRQVHARRLTNGLQVVVCPDPGGADVSVLVRYNTGSRDEPGGLEGLAHFVEHLMFTGSKHVARGELDRLLTQAGATNMNGMTGPDLTLYQETLPPERLELALWLESDRMGYLLDRLTEEAVERERAVVLNEYRERVTDAALGDVGRIMREELFPAWHPYHHGTTGTAASIARIELADVRAFVNTWYGPANATVTITGKVDPAAAMALAERYFGPLPARDPPVRPALPALPELKRTVLRIGAPVTRREVRVAWLTPPLRAPGDEALDLAATILADGESSWLSKKLLKPPRVATQVTAHQSSSALASVFEIRAVVADEHSGKEVFDAIDEGLARFVTAMDATDMSRAKIAWYNEKLFSLESSLIWAFRLGSQIQVAPRLSVFDGGLGTYAAITPEQVRAAVQQHLLGKTWVITMVEPTRGAPLRGALLSRVVVPR